jgi:hypothetical protein
LPAVTNVPIAAIDCETTGVHWRKQIWEAAVIRREPDGVESETSFFIDVDLRDADGIGLSIGRFYDRHPLGREIAGLEDEFPARTYTRAQAAMRIARWTHGAHMIGNVTSFDTIAFERLMRRQSLTPSWHYHLIDVENLAVGYLKGVARMRSNAAENLNRLPWDSDALSALLGVKPPNDEERHTALGDARWALAMWDAVMG